MASKILKELHDTAKDMHDAGALNTTTMREFDALCLPPVKKRCPSALDSHDSRPDAVPSNGTAPQNRKSSTTAK